MKALALLSGGLDSLLAVTLLERHGVALECVHFVTGFNHRGYRESLDRHVARGDLPPAQAVDIRTDYLPRVARGVGLEGRDPCVDCRILMLEQAAALARERGIDILVTGEVVGQRARGQSRSDLLRVEREAGVAGRVWRPLSAAYLTPPDAVAGLVGAAALVALSARGTLQGRSRRDQFALAQALSLVDTPTPSGGCCRLTDPRFVRRLSDELQHRDAAALGPDDLELLSVGRHFRLSSGVKVILGRDESESAALVAAAHGRWTFQVESGRGAVGLILGDPATIGFEELGALAARYSAERQGAAVRVTFRGRCQSRIVLSRPADPEFLSIVRI